VAFTYDVATDRGKVRLGLGDTKESTGIFTDAEIDHFLTTGGTVAKAIEYGLRMLMAAHAARGDAARVLAIRERLATTGGDLPYADVIYPSALPMDQGFDEST
jgi:hypothetical protein